MKFINFGAVIFILSLIGGEVVRWLGQNWRVVIFILTLVIMILSDLMM